MNTEIFYGGRPTVIHEWAYCPVTENESVPSKLWVTEIVQLYWAVSSRKDTSLRTGIRWEANFFSPVRLFDIDQFLLSAGLAPVWFSKTWNSALHGVPFQEQPLRDFLLGGEASDGLFDDRFVLPRIDRMDSAGIRIHRYNICENILSMIIGTELWFDDVIWKETVESRLNNLNVHLPWIFPR